MLLIFNDSGNSALLFVSGGNDGNNPYNGGDSGNNEGGNRGPDPHNTVVYHDNSEDEESSFQDMEDINHVYPRTEEGDWDESMTDTENTYYTIDRIIDDAHKVNNNDPNTYFSETDREFPEVKYVAAQLANNEVVTNADVYKRWEGKDEDCHLIPYNECKSDPVSETCEITKNDDTCGIEKNNEVKKNK